MAIVKGIDLKPEKKCTMKPVVINIELYETIFHLCARRYKKNLAVYCIFGFICGMSFGTTQRLEKFD